MSRPIYIFQSGRLARKANTVYFENGEGVKRYIPVENTSEIYLFGEIDLNKDALEFFAKNEIILHFFNYYEYYVGSFYPREHYNSGYMIVKQVEHYLNPQKRLMLAKRFVEGAGANIQKVLSYYLRRGADVSSQLNVVADLVKSIDDQPDVPRLMALEGKMHETYYGAFPKIVEQEEFELKRRTRRPPKDSINALVSFANSLVYSTVLSSIYKTHLDPRIGFLHESNFRSFSLNLDVAEIFKPIIADRAVFSAINKQIIDTADFEKRLNGIYLNESGAKKFVQVFDEKLQSTLNYKKIKRNVSYKTLIRLELYKLEKHFMGEEMYRPFVAEW